MFMSRRKKATKKLLSKWRDNLNGSPLVERGLTSPTDTKEKEVQDILSKMEEKQLKMLVEAVKDRHQDRSCILVPSKLFSEPHVLCCQYWRWSDLKHSSELRRLPQCGSALDSVYACCNPNHWSRLCKPETPPPPYSRTNVDRIRPEDRAPSEIPILTRNCYESLTTSGDSQMANPSEWCKLAYWELQERVGPLFPVESCFINVFGDVSERVDGWSLAELGSQNHRANESVLKTRAKIRLGVTLSREPGGSVWLYNRSDQPVFVSSLYLQGGLGGPGPIRVPAEHCLCIHAPGGLQTYGWENFNCQGPMGDPNAIRVSFVKGWGTKYARRDITSCPCSIEILLAPCR